MIFSSAVVSVAFLEMKIPAPSHAVIGTVVFSLWSAFLTVPCENGPNGSKKVLSQDGVSFLPCSSVIILAPEQEAQLLAFSYKPFLPSSSPLKERRLCHPHWGTN
jgi:hypothetical protein